ncbi:MAG TPA: hypothetical protein VMF53_13150 [Alphaproteobacteria bacterium]|nr:hypothetical protein [Alphaproteobacteria bacterium]
MHAYSVAGLSVESEFVLPGLIPGAADGRSPDVTIKARPVPEALEDAGAAGPTWQIAGARFLLRIPDVARFLLDGGRAIDVEPENGAAADDIAIFLIGTVLGILLHQRGQIVLHASAVRVGGKAVLFCGPSGAGKSTLAAALARHGFPLVADDVCAILIEAGAVPIVHPDGRQLKLWAQAIDRLGLDASRGAAVRRRLEKFYVEPAAAFAAPLPLGAVYALREALPPNAPGIERPNLVDGALLLGRNAYRPLLVRRLGQKADYFRAASAIANSAGIFHLTRHLDFAQMPDVISGLERHWDEIGLAQRVPA